MVSTIYEEAENLKNFDDLEVGAVFNYFNIPYIKTKTFLYDCECYNAVNLENGSFDFFDDDEVEI